jgi:hypothetical protein
MSRGDNTKNPKRKTSPQQQLEITMITDDYRPPTRPGQIDWHHVLAEAAKIADSYYPPPTLRQLFYRLVAAGLLPNTKARYNKLSTRSAEARRAGTFPTLTDGTRSVVEASTYDSPQDAVGSMVKGYRLDRMQGQEVQLWVIVEKATLENIAFNAAYAYGVPVCALRGYGSQTIIDVIGERILQDERPATLLYLGDHDPTGTDIDRDLLHRLRADVEFERLAVTPDQITTMNLVPMMGKRTDTRAAAFKKQYGQLIQVEVEAIMPDVLSRLIRDAIRSRIDLATLQEAKAQEEADIEVLQRFANSFDEQDGE